MKRPHPKSTCQPADQDSHFYQSAWRKYHDLIESIDGIVWEADARTLQFTFVSRQAERLLGFPIEAWYQRDFWVNHLHPEDRDRACSHCIQSTQAMIPHEFEYRLIAKDGREIWVRDIVSVITEDGKPKTLRGIIVDISKQKAAEIALTESERRFRALMDANIIGIIVTNFDGHVLEANKAFLDLLGYTFQDLKDDKISLNRSTPDQYVFQDRNALWQLQSTGVARAYEKELFTKSGKRVSILFAGAKVRENLEVAFVLDITERQRLLTEAREAARIREEFMGIASHELRTPLTPLALNIQLLKQILTGKRPDVGQVDRLLDISELQVNRLTSLVNDLLDASNIQTGRLPLQPEPTDLNQLVSKVIERFQSELQTSGIRLIYRQDAQITGNWDTGRIEQVVENLISNAIKYGKRSSISVSISQSHQTAILSVKDRGIGISENDTDRIFARFERAVSPGKYGGLGLGLFIVRQIIEAHGGSIKVESSPNRGSTFTVTIPLQVKSQVPASEETTKKAA